MNFGVGMGRHNLAHNMWEISGTNKSDAFGRGKDLRWIRWPLSCLCRVGTLSYLDRERQGKFMRKCDCIYCSRHQHGGMTHHRCKCQTKMTQTSLSGFMKCDVLGVLFFKEHGHERGISFFKHLCDDLRCDVPCLLKWANKTPSLQTPCLSTKMV